MRLDRKLFFVPTCTVCFLFSDATEPAKELNSEIPEINRKILKINSEQVSIIILCNLFST